MAGAKKMVELTARTQFLAIDSLKGRAVGWILVFDQAHTSFLKPFVESEHRWEPHGKIKDGLILRRAASGGNRLRVYNPQLTGPRQMKVQLNLYPVMNGVSVDQPPTKLVPVKLRYHADKQEFHVDPIDPAKLPTREKRKKDFSKRKEHIAKHREEMKGGPMQELRDHIRATNQIATSLGIELTVSEGKVRAVLTFE